MENERGYVLIRHTGRMEVVKCNDKLDFSRIREAIGCEYLEPVYLEDRLVMLVDDAGKMNGLPVNPMATILYESVATDFIVGNAVIVTIENGDLECLELERAERLAKKWMVLGKSKGYHAYVTVEGKNDKGSEGRKNQEA